MPRHLAAATFALLLAAAASPALAEPAQPEAAPSLHTRFSLGAGLAGGTSYLVAGAGISKPLLLGLEADLNGQYWFGGSPRIAKLAPGLTWVLPLPRRPYVGGYVARWFIGSGVPDRNAVGLRGGLSLVEAGRVGVTAGLAWERQLRCSGDCDSWTPEVVAGVAF